MQSKIKNLWCSIHPLAGLQLDSHPHALGPLQVRPHHAYHDATRRCGNIQEKVLAEPTIPCSSAAMYTSGTAKMKCGQLVIYNLFTIQTYTEIHDREDYHVLATPIKPSSPCIISAPKSGMAKAYHLPPALLYLSVSLIFCTCCCVPIEIQPQYNNYYTHLAVSAKRRGKEKFPHRNWPIIFGLQLLISTAYFIFTPSVYQFVTTPRSVPEDQANEEVRYLSHQILYM